MLLRPVFSQLFPVPLPFFFTRKYAGRDTAALTSVILLASVHLSIQFHLAVPDPYLIFFMTAAFMSFYSALKEKKPVYLLFLYLSIGLGTLTKGPVAIGLPGLVFLLFLIFTRRLNLKELKFLRPFPGAVLVLLTVLPWYILVHLKTGGAWTEGFFLKHNLGRFTSEMEGHGGLFLITVAYLFVGMFPFSVFLVQAVKKAWKERGNDFVLFNLVTALTIVFFFTASRTKLPNYTVPAYPFLAIPIALYLRNASGKQLKAGMIAFLITGLLLTPAIYLGLKLDPALAPVDYVAWYFLPLPVCVVLAWWYWKKKKNEISVLFVALSGVATALIFFCLAFPVIDRQNPVVKSAGLLKGKEVRYYERFNPAYGFMLGKTIPPIGYADFHSFFEQYPDGVIISARKHTDKIKLPEGLEINFSARDIFERPVTVLITRRKN